MRVVHISYSDHAGGAAIAARRHHEALRESGFDSRMIVIDKGTRDDDIVPVPTFAGPFARKVASRLFKDAVKPFGTWSHNGMGNDLSDHPLVREADVVVLHWVNSWTISLKSIEKILATGKPVVWFMHDMWAVTGGCHHAMDCTKFKDECFRCELLGRQWGADLAGRQFEEKLQRLEPYGNLVFVTPSGWLADKVKESRIGRNHKVHVVNNILDTSRFELRDKGEARRRLGLPADRRLVLFGADAITSPYKGWKYIAELLHAGAIDADWVVYGTMKKAGDLSVYNNVRVMGKITDPDRLVDLYNAADVFITPSLADTYPNVILEAQACGLPTVGFRTGGIPEMITPGFNGFVTESNDADGLRKGIEQVLQSTDFNREAIALNLVQRQKNYDFPKILNAIAG